MPGTRRAGYQTFTVMALALAAAFVFGTVLICGLVRGDAWCRWWPHLSLETIEQAIRGTGAWGAGVSIALMVLHSFVPFPSEFITITNGMVFGFWWGTLITWTGAMLGACLAFGLARRLGRSFVHRKLGERNLLRVERWVEAHGFAVLLVARFIPVVSFNLMNYAAGLLNVTWWTFAWTTGLGILPMTFLMVFMGDQIHRLPWQAWFLLLLVGICLGILARVFALRFAEVKGGPESR